MFRKHLFTCIKNIRNCTTVAKTTKDVEPEVKMKMIDKWKLYWKNLYFDYKTVVIDVITESKEKPLKTTIILSSLAFAFYCGKNNPDEVCYRDTVLRSMGDLILVSPDLQSKDSAKHIHYIQENYNLHQIRRLNLLVLSLMWVDSHSTHCQTYKCMCDYLKLPLKEFKDRILDVGFLNQWWILSKQMENYDINY